MDAIPIESWFYDIPPVTRFWALSAVTLSLLVKSNILSEFQLFYTFRATFVKHEFWRIITSFLYFGEFSLDYFISVVFLFRNCRMLEDSYYHNRTGDFLWLVLTAATFILILSPLVSLTFLGDTLSFALVYIWSRRNSAIHVSVLGLFVIPVPYLPWLLVTLSLLRSSSSLQGDLLGIVVGHTIFFLEDVFPHMHNGWRPLAPPRLWFTRIANQHHTDGHEHQE